VLAGLAHYLPERLLREVLAAAREIRNEKEQAAVLARLALHLPEELLWEALAAVREIRNEEDRAKALTELVPRLPERLLREALAAVQEIRNEEDRAKALAGLVPHLPEELLWGALAAVREIRNEEERAKALAGLVPHLPEELLWEALAAAREIRNEEEQAAVLAELAPYLPERLLRKALTAAQGIGNEEDRARALAGLVPHLPEALLSRIGRGHLRYSLDSTIATRQEPAEHLLEAFAVARIEDHQLHSPFVVNEEYKLLAGVLSNVPPEFVGTPIQLPDIDVVGIDVIVRAAGMEILPHRMQKLRFFRGRDSGLLEFRLTPREVGQKQILIEFYYQRHWLAKIQFDVEVVEMQEFVLA